MEINKTFKWMIIIAVALIALWYIATPVDLFPEGLGGYAGYIDDALIGLGAIFVIRKTYQSLKKRPKDVSIRHYLLPIIIIAAAVLYVVWPHDIVSDVIPYIGWLDDIAVVIGAALLARKLKTGKKKL
jgi:uncharacterized membrane protein YkvA (DUF1232 family)